MALAAEEECNFSMSDSGDVYMYINSHVKLVYLFDKHGHILITLVAESKEVCKLRKFWDREIMKSLKIPMNYLILVIIVSQKPFEVLDPKSKYILLSFHNSVFIN